MGDIADWLREKAMTDAESWFEEWDAVIEMQLQEGPPPEPEELEVTGE